MQQIVASSDSSGFLLLIRTIVGNVEGDGEESADPKKIMRSGGHSKNKFSSSC